VSGTTVPWGRRHGSHLTPIAREAIQKQFHIVTGQVPLCDKNEAACNLLQKRHVCQISAKHINNANAIPADTTENQENELK